MYRLLAQVGKSLLLAECSCCMKGQQPACLLPTSTPPPQANHDSRPSCEARGFVMTDHTVDLVALKHIR